MKLKTSEYLTYQTYIKEFLDSEQVQQMNQYIQHGDTTTLKHCMKVSYYSYLLCKRLHLPCDIRSVTRGAFLHDFYLYDWHQPDSSHRLHGFFHPGFALKNARKHFKLNPIEEDIILKHMWPLTLTRVPKYKESVVVCVVDKICSTIEIF